MDRKDFQKNLRKVDGGCGWVVEYRHADDRRWVTVYIGSDYAKAKLAYAKL